MELKQIGLRIRQRRRFLKVHQRDLAEIAGVSLRSLKTLESGEGNPRLSTLLSVLNALGLVISLEERVDHARTGVQ